MRTVEDTKT